MPAALNGSPRTSCTSWPSPEQYENLTKQDNHRSISDRTYVSSLAYQGGGRGLGVDAVRAVNELVLDGTIPDLVIIVDVDPRIGLGRQVEADRIGANGSDFLVEVARTYRSLVDGQRIVAVDGDGTAGEVCERILAVVQARWTL